MGKWIVPIKLYSGLISARFEGLIYNAEKITQIIHAWQVIPLYKIISNSAEELIDVIWCCPKFIFLKIFFS